MMRRNFTTFLKVALRCASVGLLVLFLLKAYHYIHPRYDEDDNEYITHPRQRSFAKKLKIDWHNYKRIAAEKLRTGIGENGAPAFLPSGLEAEHREFYDQHGFNALLSERIALNRSVKDIRHKG